MATIGMTALEVVSVTVRIVLERLHAYMISSVTDFDDGTDVTGDGDFDEGSPGPVTYNEF